MLLGLWRGVGIVDGSLVAADDLRVSHFEKSRMMKLEKGREDGLRIREEVLDGNLRACEICKVQD